MSATWVLPLGPIASAKDLYDGVTDDEAQHNFDAHGLPQKEIGLSKNWGAPFRESP